MSKQSTEWTFTGFGPEFDDHALAHLPHYHDAHAVIAHAASYVLPVDRAIIADLGCSTGYAIANLGHRLPGRTITAYGYDLDQSMLDLALTNIADLPNVHGAFHRQDLTDEQAPFAHLAAHLTLALWTLQFVPSTSWTSILRRAHERAHPDGMLIVSAKTRLPDSRWQELADGALTDWKADHGVTPQGIIDKAHALRGTMLQASTDRIAAHIIAAGWDTPSILFQWHNWAILGAWRTPNPAHLPARDPFVADL